MKQAPIGRSIADFNLDLTRQIVAHDTKKARFMFVGDPHTSSVNPKSRIDSYEDAILHKIRFISLEASRLKCDAVIASGDFFHSCAQVNNSNAFLNKLKLSIGTELPWFSIIGNHDFNDDINYINKYPLGVMFVHEVINPLVKLDIVRTGESNLEGNPITFYGFNYVTALAAKDNRSDIFTTALFQCLDEDINSTSTKIGVIHSDVYNFKNEVSLNASYFASQGIHQILVGHDHKYLGRYKIGDVHFWQPGSIARNTSSTDNLKHQPICTYFEYNFNMSTIELVEIPIPIAPASECFNIEYKNISLSIEESKENMRKLAEKVLSASSSSIDIKGVFNQLNKLTEDNTELREYIAGLLHGKGL